MKQSLILAFVLFYLGNAQSQNLTQDILTPISTTLALASVDLSTRKQLDSLVYLDWYCGVKMTTTVLGYSVGTNKPFYERKCSGMCLSIITNPLTCQPMYKTYLLVTNPFSYQTKKVSVVESCSCLAKPCQVTDKYTGIVSTYPHGSTAYDTCSQKCTCSYG